MCAVARVSQPRVHYPGIGYQPPISPIYRSTKVAVTLNPTGGTIDTIQSQPHHSVKGGSGIEARDHPHVSSKQPASKTIPSNEVTKEKKRKSSSTKDGGKLGTSSNNITQPFTEIFGPSLKPHPSDSGTKQKESGANMPSSKSLYGKLSSSKETKPASFPKDKSKETKDVKFHNKEVKEIPKRPQSPCQSLSSSGTKVTKKRKRSASASSVAISVISTESSLKDKQQKDRKDKKDGQHKTQTKAGPSEKEHDKSTKSSSQISSNSSLKTKTEVKKKKEKKKDGQSDESNIKNSTSKPRKLKEEKSYHVLVPTDVENLIKLPDDGNSSPASSISLCSLATGGIHGPLAAMMAEMEKESKLLSPLSSSPGSPTGARLKSKEMLDLNDRETEEKLDVVKTNKVRKDLLLPKHETDQVRVSEGTVEHHSQCDPSYMAELEKLRQQIMCLRDRGHIQHVVDVIEETGLYFVTDSTFDFDLCSLDKNTVHKLQSYLTVK